MAGPTPDTISPNAPSSPPAADPVAAGAYDNLEFRRLVAGEGEDQRFWESAIDGNRLVVRWGKTGKRGQIQLKTFPDGEAARKEQDRQEKEQINKGFRL
jgi:predicted DNA-binding WGR domain protein